MNFTLQKFNYQSCREVVLYEGGVKCSVIIKLHNSSTPIDIHKSTTCPMYFQFLIEDLKASNVNITSDRSSSNWKDCEEHIGHLLYLYVTHTLPKQAVTAWLTLERLADLVDKATCSVKKVKYYQ